MKKLLTFLFTLGFIISSFSQELILESINLNTELNAIDITQHPDGSILFITSKTLYSYDGKILTALANIDEQSIKLSSLCHFEGHSYLGSSKGHLYKVFADSIQEISKIGSSPLVDIVPTRSNQLAIASQGNGIHLFNTEENSAKKLFDNDLLDRSNSLCFSNESLYIGTDGGLFVAKAFDGSFELVKGTENKVVTNLIKDPQSGIWFSEFTDNVIHCNDNLELSSKFTFGNGLKINDICLKNNWLYASSSKGILSGDLNKSHEPIVLESKPCNLLLLDDENNLWTSNKTNLFKANLSFVTRNPDFKNEQEIQAIAKWNSQIVYGTNIGIVIHDLNDKEFSHEQTGFSTTCLDISDQGMAIGTYNSGLQYWFVHTEKAIPIDSSSGLDDQTILSVKSVGTDTLIVAGISGVHIMTRERDRWTSQQKITELDNYYTLSIHHSEKSGIWFGTDKKGIINFKNGKVTVHEKDKLEQSLKSIYSITEDNEGQIWAISNNLGLIRVDDSSIEAIQHPRASWPIYTSIVALNNDCLLLIGVNDISKYNPNNNELTVYDESLKIVPDEAFLNSYCASNDEILFNHHGLVYTYQDLVSDHRASAKTTLDFVEVNLNKISEDKNVFPEDENNFTFHYKGILLSNPEHLSYAYKLDGFDTDWRYTKDRSVSYPLLAPGEYKFNVNASHSQIWEDDGSVSYEFTVNKAFYKKWWFLTLMALLIGFLIYMRMTRRRLAQDLKNQLQIQKTENQLNNLKAQLNPHFLFNSFNTMIGLIEEDQERSIEFIQHLTDFYRLVLESNEEELIPIDSEIKLLRSYSHLLIERFNNGLIIEIDNHWESSFIPPLSMQLLIENAVKHNVIKATNPLRISVKAIGNTIEIRNGLSPKLNKDHSLGIGLENLKSRYRLLAGKKIEISETDKEFIVKLPIIKTKN